jgi:SAM-dependent methyltransferase
MEAYEYRKMFELEDRLWWYRGLRRHLQQAIRRAALPPDALVLDAGCGTGANLALLTQTLGRAVGCDLSAAAVSLAASRGLKRVLVADVNHLPFRSGAFDGVLCSDVMECAEVEPRTAAAELARVTRPGGRIIVSASAYEFLRSEHDLAVHSARRFSRRGFAEALAVPGVQVVAVRHLFAFFLLPIAAFRLVKRSVRDPQRVATPQSDLFLPPRPVNALLAGLARLEAAVARVWRLPFGTTLLAELKRV